MQGSAFIFLWFTNLSLLPARFRQCMKESNDTAAWDIGRTYFSIVGVPCFTLREDEACVDWSWWAGCLKYERTMMAIIQEQGPFDEVPPASNATEVPTEEVERQETTTPAHSGGSATSETTTGPPVSTSTSFQSPNVDFSFSAPTALSDSLSTLSTTRSPGVSSRGPSGGDGRKWKKFWRKHCSEQSKEKDLSDERSVHCKAFKGRLHRYNSVAVAERLANASGVVATVNGRSSADGDTSKRLLTMAALQQMQQSNVSDTEERAISEKGNAHADAAVRPTSPAPASDNATAHAGTEENALREHAGLDPLLTKANRSQPRKTTGRMNGKRQKSPAKGPATENSALHKGGVVGRIPSLTAAGVTTGPAFSTAEPAFTAACAVVTDSILVPDALVDVLKRPAARKGDGKRQQTGGKRDAEKVEENTRRLVAGYAESVSEVLSGLVKRLNSDAKEPRGSQRRGRVSDRGCATAPKRGHSDEKRRVRNSPRGRRPSGQALFVVGERPLVEARRVGDGTWLALVERRLGGGCQPPAVVERRRGGEQSPRGESRRRGRDECVGRKVPVLDVFAFYAKAYELSEQ
ncbi:uncharacterized protein LOC142905303 [Petromyzon marinus]|uniref:uncharacterized protein LOC142905303 n=1 Tax=Petromyzon marinus TaxID=7757 RepID=UPI003F72EA0B